MLWGSYLYVAVPLVLAFFLAVCGTLLLLPNEFDNHQNVIVVSILTLIFPALAFIVKAAIMPGTTLPQGPPKGAIRLLWLPLFVESIKFCILFIASRMGGLSKVLHHALNVALLLLCFVVVLSLLHNTPHQMLLYRKFYGYLTIWDDCRLAPLPPTKIKHRGSMASLGSSGSEEPHIETGPSFNLNSFSSKNKPLVLSRLMPIMSALLSHLSVMDRLYSVLPKNTLHLTSDEESVEYGENPYEGLCGLADHLIGSVDPDSSFESAVTDPGPQRCPMLRTSSSTSQLPTYPVHGSSSSASLKSSKMGFLKWFRWLVPITIFERRKSQAFYRRLQRVQIKQRFSTFSLNNNETSSLLSGEKLPLYNTVDLEAQSFKPAYSRQYNCHDFYEFAKFSNANYDEWVNAQNQVDPIFKKFGVTLEQFSIFYFITYTAELILAQFVSTMTLALPFYATISTGALIAAFTGMFVSHLFCKNFLKFQSEMSYKFNILMAFAVRAATFAGLVAFYLYT